MLTAQLHHALINLSTWLGPLYQAFSVVIDFINRTILLLRLRCVAYQKCSIFREECFQLFNVFDVYTTYSCHKQNNFYNIETIVESCLQWCITSLYQRILGWELSDAFISVKCKTRIEQQSTQSTTQCECVLDTGHWTLDTGHWTLCMVWNFTQCSVL